MEFENWWPMMTSLQDISSSLIFTRHMDPWKKQKKINWTWMMTDEILFTKLIVSRWLVFKSFTYIFIILHSASVCFSTTPSFQIPDTKKNAANIRAGSPLRVVTSSLMMLRRRPFPSAYSGLEWFRQAHEDRDIFCPGFWSEFLLQSFVALISFRRPTYSCGSWWGKKGCLSFHVPLFCTPQPICIVLVNL